MGERKGTNKYYPPDFDPKKHGSLAGYHGQHPLRERARKLGQGILIIRFEMPYNIWCDGCKNHIGMGVRYNAEKSRVGNYYTTPIYKFRMKCHLCTNHFEIKTDPANHDYVIISGARRKEQRWDPKENEQIVPEDRETHKKIERDAMYRLEHGEDDKTKLKKSVPDIKQLKKVQYPKKDDYLLNKLARTKFRDEKRALKLEENTKNNLLEKSSLNIKLLDEMDEDVKMSKLLKYSTTKSYDKLQNEKRLEIINRPLFGSKIGKNISSLSSPPKTNDGTPGVKLESIFTKKRTNPFNNDNKSPKTLCARSKLGIITKQRKSESEKFNHSKETIDTEEVATVSIVPCDKDKNSEIRSVNQTACDVAVESRTPENENADNSHGTESESNALSSLLHIYEDTSTSESE